ncbi:Alkaline phosphatase synthesis sensor protein PhoR [Pseudoalteromonas sp. P1-9]|uniref:sensor histidine kinase n=1 Tax=Pseudoalteromonas sp. P1-9 TaxID=1710354 RepID=UPI0006D5DC39|nr:HAMP domain-containing sensor histidine kinase [Pseudoalteromonas sp. P1-9]KPV93868.1 Alkaline phosphatase synthesis sensor protein PhoR [Pseudoalteromonas sp. P1-9]
MKNSLYTKLSLTLASIFILTASLFLWWTQSVSQVSRAQAEQALHLGLAEHLANDNPLLKQGVYDYKALENLFHTLMVLGPAFEFYFVDPSGKLLTFSAKPGQVKRQFIDLAPLVTLIEDQSNLPIYGDDPRNFDHKKIFSVAPVYNGDTLQGYLYVIIGSSIYDSIFASIKSSEQILVSSIWLVLGLGFLLFSMLVVFRTITKPLRTLSSFIQKVDKTEFDISELPLLDWPEQNNEIHQLGAAVNRMLITINQQMMQLTALDEQRRELLAHLSHDLRTPLASLQGYLELLNKETPNANEKAAHYLNVTLKNCGQLKALIDQIFELAHLESGQTNINLEVFNLGELIYDVMAKFALRAEKAGIQLKVHPKECDFSVYSDIAKLERILTNLIENALRHTNQGGTISVNVILDSNQYKIVVADSGVGISSEDLPYIFEARYRASNSLGCKKSHAGLGLAITNRLIQLIKSDIKVKSELGKGTEFAFTLRASKPV